MAASCAQKNINKTISFFADIKPGLSICQAVVGLHDFSTDENDQTSLTIEVDENSVRITDPSNDNQQLCRFRFPTDNKTQISPSTCHGLQMFDGENIHLRFRLESYTDLAPTGKDSFELMYPGGGHDQKAECGSIVYDKAGRYNKESSIAILSTQSCSFICGLCCSTIVDCQKFLRVLPLPSSETLESSESWWCSCSHDACHVDSDDSFKDDSSGSEHEASGSHHSHVLSNDKASKVTVHETNFAALDDCFVAEDSAVVLSTRRLRAGSWLIGEGGVIVCSRCRNEIGRLRKSGWLSGTNGRQVKDIECLSKSSETDFIQLSTCLTSLVPAGFPAQISLRSSVVKADMVTEVLPERCCYYVVVIVVVSPSVLEASMVTELLTERWKSNHFRFILETRDYEDKITPFLALWVLDVDTLLYNGRCHIPRDNNADCLLSPLHVVKVLYKDCLRSNNESVARQWYKDFMVHNIELPLYVCTSLLRTLISSTSTLPQSFQVTNDFYVGYLLREPNDHSKVA